MKNSDITFRPMTPDDVLATLRDCHRMAVEDEESDPVELTFELPIRDWLRKDGSLNEFDPRGQLSALFGVRVPWRRWRNATRPSSERTLRDVCELIASLAQVPVVESRCFLGSRCRKAGMFMLAKAWLKRAGANVDDLRPSSPTSAVFRRYPNAIRELAAKVAPGRLPAMAVSNPAFALCGWLAAIGFLLLILNFLTPFAGICGVPLLAFAYLMSFITAGHPNAVEFGQIKTMRQLCEALTGDIGVSCVRSIGIIHSSEKHHDAGV